MRGTIAATFLVAALLLIPAPGAQGAFFFDSKWGTQGSAEGQFEAPEGIAVAPSGDVYVADTGNDRIQRFDATGTFVGRWGGFGTGPGRFLRPIGLAADAGGNVYVADSGNNRVQKFGPTGTFISSIGGLGSGPGQFRDPIGVAVDGTGNLYVVDSGNNRVQKFGPGGSLITAFGTIGDEAGQFFSPAGIAIDFAGNLYVSDSGNSRIQKFDSNGAFILEWGVAGTGFGQLNVPYGVAAASGFVYVVDHANHRLQQFTDTGGFLFVTGSNGSGDGQFQFPSGVGVAPPGLLYAADTNNHRVQRFIVSGSAIIAVKDAQPNDAQDFSFTAGGGLSPSTFTLDDDGNPNNGTSNFRAFAVPQGSGYSLAESTPPPNWDMTSATCSDGSDPSNIDVSEDEVVTCTFTNRRRASITVIQDSIPNEPNDFGYTTGGGLSPSSFTLDDDGDNTNELSNTQVISDVTPGSGYSVSQTTPAGWGAPQVTCSDGSPASNIDVSPGEAITCTFKNVSDTAGQIVVVKDADPTHTQNFSFAAGGGLSPSTFLLDDDGDNTNELSNTQTFTVSPRDGYSISETTPSGWHLAAATCSDGSPLSNIDVAPSETVTCTFVNRLRGTIRVTKDAQPNDPQDFSFTTGGGLTPTFFSLDDDGDNSNALGNTRTFGGVVPGSGYSVTEQPEVGWQQSGATCSDGSDPSNIDVAPGELVQCTFTNLRQAGIRVIKDAQPTDVQDFDFTAGGGLTPSSFTLDDDGEDFNEHSSVRFFDNVAPGSGYSIAESVPSGWELSQATCSDGSPPSNISLGAAEQVTCTFVNRKLGTISVNLDTQPDDPQDFGFTTSGFSPGSFTLDDDGDNTNGLSNTVDLTGISPDSGNSIVQEPVPGWVQEDATCSDGSDPADIDVSPGEHITCTFVMSTRAKITVVKDARPNDQNDFDFAAGGGLSPTAFQLEDDGDENDGQPSKRAFIVDPGAGYSVAETDPGPPWDLTSATCSDGSPPSNIDVVAGEAVTCTFVNTGNFYARPRGASPLKVSLVPAYNQCASPNRTHGPPLGFQSCNPPVQSSTSITVGSPDANGSAANFTGTLKLKVVRSIGGPSDVGISGLITDVRCRAGTSACGAANAADGPDYSGMLRAALLLRITDRDGAEAGTVVDFEFPAQWSCVPTGSSAIGSACQLNTSAEAITPGSVPEGQRSIWEVAQVEVWDGGPDGVPATSSGDKIFLRQGVFSP